MKVLSDTSPLNYLVQIGEDSLLATLFGAVSIAPAVARELDRPKTPAAVRSWFASRPSWLAIEEAPRFEGAPLPPLHDGERETLALAQNLGADLIVMDDAAGVTAARARGFRVTGTLGVLDLAADGKFIDLGAVLDRLLTTNFRLQRHVIDGLRAKHRLGGSA